jgi:hypothetical protein
MDLTDAVEIFAFYSPYTVCVFHPPSTGVCDLTVCCKRCGQNIPAPVETMPDSWIVAHCPLCGEKRRYLPSEIFRGRISWELFLLLRRRAHVGR